MSRAPTFAEMDALPKCHACGHGWYEHVDHDTNDAVERFCGHIVDCDVPPFIFEDDGPIACGCTCVGAED